MEAAATCFGLQRKPSSGSHSQYLAKITSLVQCRYGRRTDVVSVMAVAIARITTYRFYMKGKRGPVTGSE